MLFYGLGFAPRGGPTVASSPARPISAALTAFQAQQPITFTAFQAQPATQTQTQAQQLPQHQLTAATAGFVATATGNVVATDAAIANTYRHLQYLLNLAVIHIYGTGQATQIATINGILDGTTVNQAIQISGAQPPCQTSTDPSCLIMSGDIQMGSSCCGQLAWIAANAQAMIVWLEAYLGVSDTQGSDQWYVPPPVTCWDGSTAADPAHCPPQPLPPPPTTTCPDGSVVSDPSQCPTAAPAPGSSTGSQITTAPSPPVVTASGGVTCSDGSIATDPSLCPAVTTQPAAQPTLVFGYPLKTVAITGAAVVGGIVLLSLLLRRRRSTSNRTAAAAS